MEVRPPLRLCFSAGMSGRNERSLAAKELAQGTFKNTDFRAKAANVVARKFNACLCQLRKLVPSAGYVQLGKAGSRRHNITSCVEDPPSLALECGRAEEKKLNFRRASFLVSIKSTTTSA